MNDMPSKSDYTPLNMDGSPEREPQTGLPTSSGLSNQPKIAAAQSQVAAVTNIMQENISKIIERGQKLDHLEDRSEMLSSKSEDFRVSSRRLGRKMRWQNMRGNIIIGLIVVAVIIIIYFAIRH